MAKIQLQLIIPFQNIFRNLYSVGFKCFLRCFRFCSWCLLKRGHLVLWKVTDSGLRCVFSSGSVTHC